MKRYHIPLSAKTTAGGGVIIASSCCSINGVTVEVEGDSIVCPARRSKGLIQSFGPRIPESWNGDQVALQDDLCVCACSAPPRLMANQSLKYQSLGGGGNAAEHGDAAAASAASGGRALGADVGPDQRHRASRAAFCRPSQAGPHRIEAPPPCGLANPD